MAASVWMSEVYVVIPLDPLVTLERPSAEMMPDVTVFSNPNGEPIATTGAPTTRPADDPTSAAGKPVRSILMTARSLDGSVPTTRADTSSVPMVTINPDAPSTTWLLVRM
jgi:hypothetical protein